MTTPDWSKAPEGATHWAPETEKFLESWYKNSGGIWWFQCVDYGPNWLLSSALPTEGNLVPRPHTEDKIIPDTGNENRSDGSTASYYQLPDGATELQDLISYRNMNGQLAEIFRACYRYGMASHSDQLRDAKKILFYAQAEVERLAKYGASAK